MNDRFEICEYCRKKTYKKDMIHIKGRHVCIFCIHDTPRPVDYLAKKKETVIINKQKKKAPIEDAPALEEDDVPFEEYDFDEAEDEEESSLFSDDEEDTYERYDDTLEQDSLDYSDPDDFYRNDDYDNEFYWDDKDNLYDDGWRR